MDISPRVTIMICHPLSKIVVYCLKGHVFCSFKKEL